MCQFSVHFSLLLRNMTYGTLNTLGWNYITALLLSNNQIVFEKCSLMKILGIPQCMNVIIYKLQFILQNANLETVY